jgi:pimeloyl-ACP methyl ester carboxylesterase
VQAPDVSYARSGDVSIAYHVVDNRGGPDLVFAPGYVSHLTHVLEHPVAYGFFERLAAIGRLIRFDRRGIGLSDRPRDVPTLETRMDDIRAVMDAAGSRRAVLIATGEACAMATLFAATYPERVIALVLWAPFARGVWSPDYPIGEPEASWQSSSGSSSTRHGRSSPTTRLHSTGTARRCAAGRAPAPRSPRTAWGWTSTSEAFSRRFECRC